MNDSMLIPVRQLSVYRSVREDVSLMGLRWNLIRCRIPLLIS